MSSPSLPERNPFTEPVRWAWFVGLLAAFSLLLASLPQAPQPEGTEVGHWTSVLPAVLAVLLAICFRQLLVALGSAVLLGSFLAWGPNPLSALWHGFVHFIWGNTGIDVSLSPFSFEPGGNLYIFGFTFGLVGMVHVLSRCGGTHGLVDLVLRVARNARSTRVATALMGCVIFFDDYANCVVVGTTMRPLTDRMRISREKLAFLVDATAAPVAGVAIISTWVAYEVGLFNEISEQIGLGRDGYSIFMQILPMRFYCLATLLFIFASSWLGRDFGPMLAAETRAALTGKTSADGAKPLASDLLDKIRPPQDKPRRWYNAAIPIVVVVLAVIAGMLWSGSASVREAGIEFNLLDDAVWRTAFGNANSSQVLFISSLIGSMVAIGLAVGQGINTPKEAVQAWLQGVPAMKIAVAILLLAFGIKSVCEELHTSTFLISILGQHISPSLLPLAVFLLGAAVAFATGTSWGTMGILLPVALPLAWHMIDGDPDRMIIFWLVGSAVLDGAIFGDHCSPISDTTVLSSIASNCDHIDHVRTQMPYAVACMTVASAGGYVLMSFGAPLVVSYVAIVASILGLLFAVGRRVPDPPGEAHPAEAV